jgi:hypothetical protein
MRLLVGQIPRCADLGAGGSRPRGGGRCARRRGDAESCAIGLPRDAGPRSWRDAAERTLAELAALPEQEDRRLVILPDVVVRALEQLLVLVQPVLEQRPPQGLLDFALAGVRVLPAGEADDPDDLVDIGDDALHDDRRLGRPDALEELGEGRLPQLLRRERRQGTRRRSR